MTDEDALRARIHKRIAYTEAMAANEALPRTIRVEAKKALKWLQEYRASPISRETLQENLDNKFAAWLRDPGRLRRLRETGTVVEDGQGAVTVRWDQVEPEDRVWVISYVNALVDGYRDRSVGGRPRK